jgi:hypothetical protein
MIIGGAGTGVPPLELEPPLDELELEELEELELEELELELDVLVLPPKLDEDEMMMLPLEPPTKAPLKKPLPKPVPVAPPPITTGTAPPPVTGISMGGGSGMGGAG